MSLQGIIYHQIKCSSFDSDSFLEYMAGLLKVMNLYLQENSVLVMDNCVIHMLKVLQHCVPKGEVPYFIFVC